MSSAKKIISIIKKYGIPIYIKPFLEYVHSMSENELLDVNNSEKKMTTFVRFYHKHCHFAIPIQIKTHEQNIYQNPECEMLKMGIARITLYTLELPTEYAKPYIQNIVNFLDDCDANPLIKGLVLDFRKHKGGNMWPLIEALSRYLNGSTLFSWKNHRVFKNEQLWDNLINGKKKENQQFLVGSTPNYPIAVLIGSQTASSGEFVASCFIKRPKCRLFGKQTRGYLSVNESREVDGYAFTFPTSLQTSRNGKFQECIDPDIVTSHPMKDAFNWIKTF
jgi:C-terminal processing protease CtpA/Prc